MPFKNPELRRTKGAEAARKWRDKNRERYNACVKQWRMRNPERAKEVSRNNERRRRARDPEGWAAAKRAWNLANHDKVVMSARRRLCLRHGITIERYYELLKIQNGLCAICKQPEKEHPSFCIDHDHACCAKQFGCAKCVRGLLCTKCNQGLGCFKDSREIMTSALVYLEPRADKELLVVSRINHSTTETA